MDNALATNAPASVAVILLLLDIALDSRDPNAPLKFPLTAASNTDGMSKDCDKLNAVPASIAETLNVFFALLRGAFLRGAIYSIMSNCI